MISYHYLSLLYIAIIQIASASVLNGGQVTDAQLNSDNIITKALGHDPKIHGNLLDLIAANQLKIAGEPSDVDQFLREFGIEPKATVFIEESAILKWSVRRIRVSRQYELWIQMGWISAKKGIIKKASIVPYSEKKFGYRLTHSKEWVSVIYP